MAILRKEKFMSLIDGLEYKQGTRTLISSKSHNFARNRVEIMKIFKGEKIMWHQYARCKWLKEGDANMIFFHKTASIYEKES